MQILCSRGEIVLVRKLLSMLLLAVFFAPFATPLLAFDGAQSTGLPACCRKGGKHHCMAMGTSMPDDTPHLNALRERCPYSPASVIAPYRDLHALATAKAVFAGVVSHSAVHAQTESMLRIAQVRSRQKRGPPPSIL